MHLHARHRNIDIKSHVNTPPPVQGSPTRALEPSIRSLNITNPNPKFLAVNLICRYAPIREYICTFLSCNMTPARPATTNPSDLLSIRNTLARYCVALDTKDFSLLDDVFLPSVRASYPFRPTMDNVDAVKEAIKGRYVVNNSSFIPPNSDNILLHYIPKCLC